MNKTINKCIVCGATSENTQVSLNKKLNVYLCHTHRALFKKTGSPYKRTIQTKNEYIIHDNYAEMLLYDRQCNVISSTIIDIEDVDKCKKYKWNLLHTGYVRTNVPNNNSYLNMFLHRYIMNLTDKYDNNIVVDHINRNKLDNRKQNLRIVDRYANAQNRESKGLKFANNKYIATLERFGIVYYIGSFETEKIATKKRNEAKKLFEKDINLFKSTYNGYPRKATIEHG